MDSKDNKIRYTQSYIWKQPDVPIGWYSILEREAFGGASITIKINGKSTQNIESQNCFQKYMNKAHGIHKGPLVPLVYVQLRQNPSQNATEWLVKMFFFFDYIEKKSKVTPLTCMNLRFHVFNLSKKTAPPKHNRRHCILES